MDTARTLACPNCGAPLPKHARWTAVTCAHCGASTAPGMAVLSRREFREAALRADREIDRRPDDVFVCARSASRHAGDVFVSGARFRVLRTLAHGERADVLLAERARRLTERVVLKVFRDPSDRDAAEREWVALSSLAASVAQGAQHFSLRIPSPVLYGSARLTDGPEKPCLVTRATPGFRWTLAHVRAAFPAGIDARHAVWMWRRLLELLGWVHRSGWAHGAVLPSHVIIEEREHGAILVGWSHARRIENGGSVASDLMMAARAVDSLLGPTEPVPGPLRAVLDACLAGRGGSDDGWVLKETVAEAAAKAFGPPTFVPFEMPVVETS